jgi:hypothetical protein
MSLRREITRLYEVFHELTFDLTAKDWKNLRDKNYWKADTMDEEDKLRYKIDYIREWRRLNRR